MKYVLLLFVPFVVQALNLELDPLVKNYLQVQGKLGFVQAKLDNPNAQYSEKEILQLSRLVHQTFPACGGFTVEDNISRSIAPLEDGFYSGKTNPNQAQTVESLLKTLRVENIEEQIRKFSSFNTRFHASDDGKKFPIFLKGLYETYASRRNDTKVELVTHRSTGQQSVKVTIQGKLDPSKKVILGSHLDSISGWGSDTARSPGADDNASGTSTNLEVFRVIAESNFQPDYTIEFYAYAAEEIGLRGSNEIAKDYAQRKENVRGVLQLDMTLKSPGKPHITLINDYTDKTQNEFLAKLIDNYVKVSWAYDKCGYGCSDHASWNKSGFVASFPFETTFKGMNENIHTSDDTLENAGSGVDHAAHFAKLALAYAIEQSTK